MHRIWIVLGLGLALAGRAAALDYGYGGRSHYGPYLHLDLGLAGLQSKANETFYTPEARLSGGGLDFAVAGGWSIIPNLSIGAELWEVVVLQPDVEVAGSSASTDSDSSFALVGFGPRIAYWIAPESANVFLAATFPCFTRVAVDLNGDTASTDAGLGGRLSVGKEWWVGQSQWGLGIAGHLVFSRNKDRGDGAPYWNSLGGGISFSASWN